jgi:Mg/Co/Ni transporter MgtE
VIDRRVGDETVSDVALRAVDDGRARRFEVAKVRLTKRTSLRRRPTVRLVDWDEVRELFASTAMAAEAAELRDMHPSDVASIIRALPLAHRRQLASMLDDERLADLLEELPEAEQLGLIEELDTDRLVAVLAEMEYDDLADLLAEMPGEQRTRILDAMEPDDAEVMRQLLSYPEGTAGGMMTPEIIIMGPTATVAEALAELRDPDWLVSIAAQVFVCQPPFKPPTGTYLGVVHFQRLLRESPAMELGQCLEVEPSIPPELNDREVAERIASYNLLAVPVCDEAGRLLGAITVDDVLDRVLPVGWRQQRRQVSTPLQATLEGGSS